MDHFLKSIEKDLHFQISLSSKYYTYVEAKLVKDLRHSICIYLLGEMMD